MICFAFVVLWSYIHSEFISAQFHTNVKESIIHSNIYLLKKKVIRKHTWKSSSSTSQFLCYYYLWFESRNSLRHQGALKYNTSGKLKFKNDKVWLQYMTIYYISNSGRIESPTLPTETFKAHSTTMLQVSHSFRMTNNYDQSKSLAVISSILQITINLFILPL